MGRILLVVTVVAMLASCWTNSNTAPPTAAGATTYNGPACIYDEPARRHCRDRGPRFSYGPKPYIYCRGVPPEPGDQERAEEAARNERCVCNDLEWIDKRRSECSQIP